MPILFDGDPIFQMTPLASVVTRVSTVSGTVSVIRVATATLTLTLQSVTETPRYIRSVPWLSAWSVRQDG